MKTRIELRTLTDGGQPASVPHKGLALNALVKSGGNSFTGTGYYAYTGKSLLSNKTRAQKRSSICRGRSLCITIRSIS